MRVMFVPLLAILPSISYDVGVGVGVTVHVRFLQSIWYVRRFASP